MLLCRRIAHELMLSVTLQATLNKASLSLSLSFSVCITSFFIWEANNIKM